MGFFDYFTEEQMKVAYANNADGTAKMIEISLKKGGKCNGFTTAQLMETHRMQSWLCLNYRKGMPEDERVNGHKKDVRFNRQYDLENMEFIRYAKEKAGL